jgi:hypothetical protein
MAEYLKVLGQINPPANTIIDAYTVPVGKSAAVSSVIVCNLDPNVYMTFNVSIAVGGAADNIKQYIYYMIPVDVNDAFIATIGLSLSAGDVIRVFSSGTMAAFNISGIEIG